MALTVLILGNFNYQVSAEAVQGKVGQDAPPPPHTPPTPRKDFTSYFRNKWHKFTWVYTEHKQWSFPINKTSVTLIRW